MAVIDLGNIIQREYRDIIKSAVTAPDSSLRLCDPPTSVQHDT